MRWVVDASVVVQTLIPETGSDLAHRVIKAEIGAPDLVFVETTNVLWKVHRRGGLTFDQLFNAAMLMSQIKMEILPGGSLTAAALSHAIAMDHAAYDCFYTALAQREKIPLITADASLKRKVGSAGLSVQVLLLDEAIALL